MTQKKRNLAADDLAGLQALGADVGLVLMAVGLYNRNALDVGTEGAVGHTMGVADAATSDGVLTTNRANLGHFSFSLLHKRLLAADYLKNRIALATRIQYYTTLYDLG